MSRLRGRWRSPSPFYTLRSIGATRRCSNGRWSGYSLSYPRSRRAWDRPDWRALRLDGRAVDAGAGGAERKPDTRGAGLVGVREDDGNPNEKDRRIDGAGNRNRLPEGQHRGVEQSLG